MEKREDIFTEMEAAPDRFGRAVRGASAEAQNRRPDEKNWSAKEIICHVRDTEEFFLNRFQMILSFEEPKFSPADAGRWAAERQYHRHDIGEALAAFGQRRRETLAFLRGLGGDPWERTCVHSVRGRMTMGDYLNLVAGHDRTHLDQLRRALDGKA